MDFVLPPQVIARYKEILQGYDQDLAQALGRSSFEEVHGIAHKIKGSAGMYGYPRVSELAAQLMKEASVSSLESAQELRHEIRKILPTPAKPRVLVVDDDEAISMIVKEALEVAGLECETCGTISEATRLMGSFDPQAVLLDYRLPEGGAQAFVDSAQGQSIKHSIVLMSANDKLDLLARQLGLSCYIKKPFSIDELYTSVSKILGSSLQEAS